MEGTTTTTVPKTAKPKKSNGKTDSGKTTKQSSKGKNPYDKSKNFDDGKCGGGSYGLEGSLKKRPAPDDFMKQDNKIGGYGVMATEQMNNFAPVMFDPFANAASYWTPSAGTILSTDSSTFPYMMPMPDLQHHQQQQQQLSVDPFANMYLGPMAQQQTGEDMNMLLNQGWGPQSYDQMFSNDQLSQNHANSAAQLTAITSATPNAATASTNPPEWNNQMDFCFSGCCQPPPPYPSTPSIYREVPPTDRPGDPLMSAPAEPWVPPPPQNQWVAIKPEPGEDGNVDDIFVKVESDA